MLVPAHNGEGSHPHPVCNPASHSMSLLALPGTVCQVAATISLKPVDSHQDNRAHTGPNGTVTRAGMNVLPWIVDAHVGESAGRLLPAHRHHRQGLTVHCRPHVQHSRRAACTAHDQNGAQQCPCICC